MSLGLLFSGQGAQHPQMVSWLERDPAFEAAAWQLDPHWRTRLADPAWAGRNAVAQPLLTGVALAAWAQLQPLLPAPAAVAGYSVGEVAAFAAAGVYDSATALQLARDRAALMDRDAAAADTGLLGVVGLTPERVDRLCSEHGLALAIRNGCDSVVLGGPRASLDGVERTARGQGAHCTALNVALASHTHWMTRAAQDFARLIEPLSFAAPRAVLFSGADGRIAQPGPAKAALSSQIARTVAWDACMDGMAARRVACVLEVGPGQALARLWNQRHPQIPARSVDEFRSTRAITDWVWRNMA